MLIGVLALQGAFKKHLEMLLSLGANAIEVRKVEDLAHCDALIIPGGESTTILKQIDFVGLEQPLKDFASQKPIFGTCAGLILISHEILKDKMKPFNLLNISVERNAFGRQCESFQAEVELHLSGVKSRHFPAIFIRAPRIRAVGEEVQVLAAFEGEPILVRQGIHLGATFHPELTSNPAIHQYFLHLVKNQKVR